MQALLTGGSLILGGILVLIGGPGPWLTPFAAQTLALILIGLGALLLVSRWR